MTALLRAHDGSRPARSSVASPADGAGVDWRFDVERLRQAALDVEGGYILMPDRTSKAYWRKVADRYAALEGASDV